jgi:protein phosphatase
MGGHEAGEVASSHALQTLESALRGGATLAQAVAAANRAVYELASARPGGGMGTTLVAVLRTGSRYQIANVGDSRAYRVAQGRVEQVTRDHSFVEEAVRTGEMSMAEAQRSPWRNALTRAVGTDPEVEVDVFGPFDATRPHLVILCSDGLYRSLPPAVLAQGLDYIADLSGTARSLVEVALEHRATDNVTVAVVEMGAAAGAAMGAGVGAAPSAERHAEPPREPPRGGVARAWETPPPSAPAVPAADGEPPTRRYRHPHRRAAVWRWRMTEAVFFLIGGAVLLVCIAALLTML